MKRVSLLIAFLILVAALPAAGDFSLLRTLSTPGGTTHLTGLDNADGYLFAVENLGPDGSCLYLLYPQSGEVVREACLGGEPPGCPGEPHQYLSCAFNPWGDTFHGALCLDAYWVGDACGDLIKYEWTETCGLVYRGHCMPVGIGEPVGMAYYGGYVYYIDAEALAIFKLSRCFGDPPAPCHLPDEVTAPSALACYGGNFFVGSSDMDAIYEIGLDGALVDVHHLEDFHTLNARALTGMTFIGDYLYVATNDDLIFVYEFAEFGGEVPEGEDVYVEPVPEGLGVGFPTVTEPGSLYVEVSGGDPCPPPQAVGFLPDFYEIMVTASFEYAAQIVIMTSGPLPEGVNPNKVRIFSRPSGECMPWMDITVAPLELVEPGRARTLRVSTRTVSEDDQFSVFSLGVDRRNPLDVILLKFIYLEEAIEAVGGTPVDPIEEMMELLDEARMAAEMRGYRRAARLVDRIAEIAIATPEIPHTYTPDVPDGNLGGRIVARAHTLAFSLRQMMRDVVLADGPTGPALSMARPSVPEVSVNPNPSTNGVVIGFAPVNEQTVSIDIYSVKGELVRTLARGVKISGPQAFLWDGRSDHGEPVAAGTYFVVVREGESTTTKKVIISR